MSLGACQLSALVFPMVDDFDDLIHFDANLSKEARHNIFRFYRDCIKRHMYARHILGLERAWGGQLWPGRSLAPARTRYLSKNPTFTLRLQTVLEVFPDASVVVMVRDPFKAVPSMVSYIAHCLRMFSTPTVRYPYNRELAALCLLHYTYPIAVSRMGGRHAQQICVMHYELCVENLVRSMLALYRHLGLNITGFMAAELQREAQFAHAYSSPHHYDLQLTCGQSEAEFIEQHRAAFELFPAYMPVRKSPSWSGPIETLADNSLSPPRPLLRLASAEAMHDETDWWSSSPCGGTPCTRFQPLSSPCLSSSDEEDDKANGELRPYADEIPGEGHDDDEPIWLESGAS
mmetsp:Transcript_18928/g.54236  ORF Transcript_18928/g.54236 Transcript_18928/m.54236 type:complete len:346 (+) Transcript_18928:3-1040(+)